MMKNFIINQDTLCFMQNGKNKDQTIVLDKDDKFIVQINCFRYLKDCCKFFGDSYGVMRNFVIDNFDFPIKTPIVLSKSDMIIFFPTKSPDSDNCIWISYNNIERYVNDDGFSKLYFKGGKIVKLRVSFAIMDNQITKCIKIEKFLRGKNREKSY